MSDENDLICEIKRVSTDAISFWEWRRLLYNGILLVTTLVCYGVVSVGDWWRVHVRPRTVLILFLMAVGANILYCSAYPVDLFVQLSNYQDTWKRYRWLLFVLGTAVAVIFAAVSSVSLFMVTPPA